MQTHYVHVHLQKKALYYFMAGLCLLAAALLLMTRAAKADTPSYDPYADSVANSSVGVINPNNAVGAPNGTNAQMAGINSILTLDMGSGEEGTQSLRVHFGQISAVVNVNVEFLDNNQSVISSENRQLGINPNPTTQNFAYNWANFGKAYRYVRISSSQAGVGVNVDAVEALGYIGSTASQDTDGDGIPDRTEQQNGTDPLVPTPRPSTGGGGNNTVPASTGNGSNSNGASAQVNPPPAASNDKDGDGMPDDWETAHGLDPKDKTDAGKDPDHDGINSLTEYQIGSDPQKFDTDGDGMPDGWEYEHGLDVNKNDANGDPDGDFLTNLGEYRHGTDPNKADDLYKVFGTDCKTSTKNITPWEWFWIIALLVGAGGSLLMALKTSHSAKKAKAAATQAK